MRNATLLPAVTAANKTTAWFDLGDGKTYSVHVVFTGADVVGTLTLEASDTTDASGNAVAADFVTVPGSSQAVTGSANHVWSVTGAGYRFVRAKFVFTSGTGTIAVYLVAKDDRIVGG
jgi:hypothetical protein